MSAVAEVERDLIRERAAPAYAMRGKRKGVWKVARPSRYSPMSLPPTRRPVLPNAVMYFIKFEKYEKFALRPPVCFLEYLTVRYYSPLSGCRNPRREHAPRRDKKWRAKITRKLPISGTWKIQKGNSEIICLY